MFWLISKRLFKRATASLVLLAYASSCTHLPSGEKAFSSFDSCFAANLGLAAAGGIGIGLLGGEITRQLTGDASAARTVAATAGIAAAAMIAMTAWKKCSAVYNTSTPIGKTAQPKAPDSAPSPNRKPGLSLDRMSVKLDGNEDTPPTPEFDFSYAAATPAAKDIKAKFRHKVEIVRFAAGDDDKLVLADDKDNPLKDSAGKTIPLEQASRMNRDKLHWVTIAEDGRDDYVEDVIIQQGTQQQYRHKLQVPPRAKLPLPLPVPMRYTLTVEADNQKSTRSVDFMLLPTNQRPKTYASGTASNAGEAPEISKRSLPAAPATPSAPPAGTAAFTATHTTSGRINLRTEPNTTSKIVTTLNLGTKVAVQQKQMVTANNKNTEWAKVVTETGAAGWISAASLVGAK